MKLEKYQPVDFDKMSGPRKRNKEIFLVLKMRWKKILAPTP